MKTDVNAAVVIEGVTWVGATRVGADGAFEAAWVIGIPEVVVPVRILAESGVVTSRGERERCATGPAPDHLGAQESLVGAVHGSGVQVLAVGGHLGVQFAEDHVGAVAAEDRRRRHRRQFARLIGVAENDLAGLEWLLSRVRRGPSAAFDSGLADSVLEPERGAAGRELVALLSPDQFDAGEFFLGAPCLFGGGTQDRGVRGKRGDRDVRLAGAQRFFPVFGAAFAGVAQDRCPCRRHRRSGRR